MDAAAQNLFKSFTLLQDLPGSAAAATHAIASIGEMLVPEEGKESEKKKGQ